MKSRLLYRILVVFAALALYSCKTAPEISGFDSKQWKDDPMGCKNQRAKFFPILEKNKDKFIKVESGQILKLLGRPDRNELYKRTQRYYVYFVNSGSQCKGVKGNYGKILRIRFDALQRVSEVITN
ncbi:hypothetical protein BKI52_40150 [marine bacterium AO1-C]|nr:hypothetical protein BKI52_40150 [marine bacterium AO1-C]